MSNPSPRSIICCTFAALLTLLIGCNSSNQSNDDGGSTTLSSAKLTQFESCESLKSYLISTAEQQNLLTNYVAELPGSVDDAADSPEPISFEEDQPTIETVTGTNNQVAGVDEADFVKTDGDHTYLLSGNYFMVLQTWPAAESQELSRTEIDGTPVDLLIYGDTAWVVSEIYQEGYAAYGFKSIIYPKLETIYYYRIMVLVMITAVLASIYPAITALRLDPVKAIRKI